MIRYDFDQYKLRDTHVDVVKGFDEAEYVQLVARDSSENECSKGKELGTKKEHCI